MLWESQALAGVNPRGQAEAVLKDPPSARPWTAKAACHHRPRKAQISRTAWANPRTLRNVTVFLSLRVCTGQFFAVGDALCFVRHLTTSCLLPNGCQLSLPHVKTIKTSPDIPRRSPEGRTLLTEKRCSQLGCSIGVVTGRSSMERRESESSPVELIHTLERTPAPVCLPSPAPLLPQVGGTHPTTSSHLGTSPSTTWGFRTCTAALGCVLCAPAQPLSRGGNAGECSFPTSLGQGQDSAREQ